MNNIVPSLRYLWSTMRHKYYVLVAGRRIGAPLWLLITHDLSKFSLKEFPHQGRRFFGGGNNAHAVSVAGLHHHHHNKHHWEYWVPLSQWGNGYRALEPVPMPRAYILEMVADWMGACRVYEGSFPSGTWKRARINIDTAMLHPDTRSAIIEIITNTLGLDIHDIVVH